MSDCNNLTLAAIAAEIKNELSEDSSLSISYLTTWLRDNIGRLNTLIGTCYTIDSETLEISDNLTEDQKTIFKSVFYCHYYSNMANKDLGASGFAWTAIDEADTKIRRASKTDIAKTFILLSKDCNENLNKMVFYYKTNKALPRSLSSWNSPVFLYSRVDDPQQPITTII
mgnify:FL=1